MATKATPPKRSPAREAERPWQTRFLEALVQVPSVSAAAQAAGVHRATAYKEREKDPEFAAAWDEAEEIMVDAVEAAVLQEAAIMGTAPALKIYVLKTRRRQKWGEVDEQQLREQAAVEARRATIAELEAQIAVLPEGPREIVMAALARAAQKELTP